MRKKLDKPLQFLIPSIWDHHCHLSQLGALKDKVDLRNVSSPKELYKIIERKVKKLGAGEWLLGFGWDQNKWQGEKTILKEIDKVSLDNPIFLERIDYHCAIVNSKALKISSTNLNEKIDGGFFEVENGEFTGVAVDKAREKIASKIDEPPLKTIKKYFKRAIKVVEENYLSGVTDVMLSKNEESVLIEMDKNNKLSLPIIGFKKWTKEQNIPSKLYKGKKFKVSGIKVFLDGALGSNGAALNEPYGDDQTNRGVLLFNRNEIKEIIKEANKKKCSIAFHTIGDRSLEEFLSAYESFDRLEIEIRLEHLQVTPPPILERLLKTDITFSLQPTHYISDKDWAIKKLGRERFKFSYLLKTLIKKRKKYIFGTDFPIEEINPLRTINAALFRDDGQSITFKETFFGMRAPSCFQGFKKGVLITFKPNKDGNLMATKMEFSQ